MPSFLSKVFGGRKKQDDKQSQGRVSDASLLEGKFEAVSPTVSPTADKFAELPKANGNGHGKEKEKAKESGRTKPVTPPVQGAPHLSLHLPGPKDEASSRALGVVFEADPDAQILLADSVIGQRRLSPLETLILVRACSQAITARGLETLGIMHPHWYSASPDIQRRLISLFIQSLAPKSPITTLSPTPSAPVSAFESEIISTRSPHDVAAVLRWGLRHLQLDGAAFGKDAAWYTTFLEAERTAGYPSKAFSEKLVPHLPAAHLELLTATLDVLSSLAAHAEANSISGSKLSKFLGLWLLTIQRVEEKDDWTTFYARWERTGRILEHLFLSNIRDEAASQRMPRRLVELVHNYPYSKGADATSGTLLPRPRFSTRQYDTLFVHIESELPTATTKLPSYHPLRLIADAFKSDSASLAGGEHAELWEKIKQAGVDDGRTSPGGYPGLSRIFADETIRFFSLIPVENVDNEKPAFNLYLPERPKGASRRRSFSLSDRDQATAAAATATANATANGRREQTGSSTSSVAPVQGTDAIAIDWTQFSTSGFLESASIGTPLASTLLDQDVEKTVPSRKSSRSKSNAPNQRGRKSLDALPPITTSALGDSKTESAAHGKLLSKSTKVDIIQLDEAFIDFWSDALLDPISSDWPAFIICKLKSTVPDLTLEGGKRVEWLVIEQAFVPPPVTAVSPHSEAHTIASTSTRRPGRPSSPKPSFKSDISSSFTKKRFSLFSSKSSQNTVTTPDKSSKGRKKAGKGPTIGEMGEILAEEDERPEVPVRSKKASDAEKVKAAAENGNGVGKPVKEEEEKKVEGKGDAVDPTIVAGVTAVAVVTAAAATVLGDSSSPEEKKVDDAAATVPSSEPLTEATVAPEAAAPEVPAEAPISAAVEDTIVPESSPAISEPPTSVVESTPPPAEVRESVIEPVIESTPVPAEISEPVVVEPVIEPPQEAEAAPEPEVSASEPSPVALAAVPRVLAVNVSEAPSSDAPSSAYEPNPVVPPGLEQVVVAEVPAFVEEPATVAVIEEPAVESIPDVQAEEPIVEEPATVAPVVEEPAAESIPDVQAEEPIVEEAVTVAPVVEEPAIESIPDVQAEEPIVEEPSVEAPPAIEDAAPVVLEVVSEPSPVVEEPEPEPPSPEAEQETITEATPVVAVTPVLISEVVAEPTPIVEEPVSAPEPEAVEPVSVPEIAAEPTPIVEETVQATEPETVAPTSLETTSDPEIPVAPVFIPEVAAQPTPVVEEVATPPATEPEPETPVSIEEPVAEPVATSDEKVEEEPQTLEPAGVVEPLREPSPEPTDAAVDLAPVPVVESEPVLVQPEIEIPPVTAEETIPAAPSPAPSSPAHEETTDLPPAHENVLLSGATPGPEIALSSSEPVAVEDAAVLEEPTAQDEDVPEPNHAPQADEELTKSPPKVEATAIPTDAEVVTPAENHEALESQNDDAKAPITPVESNGHTHDHSTDEK